MYNAYFILSTFHCSFHYTLKHTVVPLIVPTLITPTATCPNDHQLWSFLHPVHIITLTDPSSGLQPSGDHDHTEYRPAHQPDHWTHLCWQDDHRAAQGWLSSLPYNRTWLIKLRYFNHSRQESGSFNRYVQLCQYVLIASSVTGRRVLNNSKYVGLSYVLPV